MAKQTVNGKAFEYALLQEFYSRLSEITKVSFIDNAPYKTAKKCFDSFDQKEKDAYVLNASFAINFLIDIEPRLSHGISDDDKLELEIVADKDGQDGDVRDVLAIRSLQKWEIGISAKNNHKAVKHSRLSNTIDFGQKWVGIPCSQEYFSAIKPIFDHLAILQKESKKTQKWEALGDYHSSVYVPILNAFGEELKRLDKENPRLVAENLVKYLIGHQDFYKVIKGRNKVEIHAYNLHGTLNLSLGHIKPKAKITRLRLPNRLIEVVYKDDSKTTIIVTLNEGWQISFRIHNASSRIEPSLKFDINLISSPHSMFINQFLF